MNVIFYGKRDFADVLKLRILRWEDYPKLSRYILSILHTFLIRVIQDGLSEKKKNMYPLEKLEKERQCKGFFHIASGINSPFNTLMLLRKIHFKLPTLQILKRISCVV